MASQSEKLTKCERELEEALIIIKKLEGNKNSQQDETAENELLQQLSNITEKAEKLAFKISG